MENPEPIAIIACGGRLALECIEHARRDRLLAGVIALDGESDSDVVSQADAVLKWGQVGQLIKSLETIAAKKVLLIGSISKRPDFRSVIGDFETIKWLPKLLTTMAGGDDNVLRKVIGFFESGGYQIVSIADVAPDLLAPAGYLSKKKPGDVNRRDIKLGFEVLGTLAPFDIGQSVVVGNGRIAAVEGAEGTDAMILRTGDLQAKRRLTWKDRTGILVKATKRDQDLRVDLPVIGPETVKRCAEAGLAGIAVEAGRVVIASRLECLEAADRLGLFVTSLDRNQIATQSAET